MYVSRFHWLWTMYIHILPRLCWNYVLALWNWNSVCSSGHNWQLLFILAVPCLPRQLHDSQASSILALKSYCKMFLLVPGKVYRKFFQILQLRLNQACVCKHNFGLAYRRTATIIDLLLMSLGNSHKWLALFIQPTVHQPLLIWVPTFPKEFKATTMSFDLSGIREKGLRAKINVNSIAAGFPVIRAVLRAGYGVVVLSMRIRTLQQEMLNFAFIFLFRFRSLNGVSAICSKPTRIHDPPDIWCAFISVNCPAHSSIDQLTSTSDSIY